MERKGVREIVIRELLNSEIKKNAKIPYLSGVIRGAGELSFSPKGFIVKIKHTNRDFVYGIAKIINDIYGEEIQDIKCNEMFLGYAHDNFYKLEFNNKISSDLLERAGIVHDKYHIVDSLSKSLLPSNTAKKAFLKGLFLACGFLKVPDDSFDYDSTAKSGYTLTFNLNSDTVKKDIIDLLSKDCHIDKTSIHCKKKGSAVYLKSGDAICNVLTYMGAVEGALLLFDIISSRKMKNDLNRANNCDLANISKSVFAGAKQIEAIEKLENNGMYDELSSVMKETCEMRKRYPDIGIEELGKLFSPPISKSCINHRLRKIIELADRKENETNIIK